ncbi:hypothetical protein [Pantoea stewartii]|uniref:hypothetical protein n=1 Tax=Pantoea stewartii TaxID=66269 RepID=UPI0025A178E6|nr:hypothetical protein [Pantoea stewartii]
MLSLLGGAEFCDSAAGYWGSTLKTRLHLRYQTNSIRSLAEVISYLTLAKIFYGILANAQANIPEDVLNNLTGFTTKWCWFISNLLEHGKD